MLDGGPSTSWLPAAADLERRFLVAVSQATMARPGLRRLDTGFMPPPRELARVLSTDEDVLVVQVLANDPRSWPTEGLIVVAPAAHITLADLEAIPGQLRDECGWGLGYEQDVSKVGGGIGADGATVLGLLLGVIGAVPTVGALLRRLGRQVPPCPEREEAWETATWAVALQYRAVDRKALRLLKEARNSDHWVFALALPRTGDEFEVEVYGSRTTAVATRVRWTNGDPWGRGPGLVDPE